MTATDALMRQISTLQEASEILRAGVNDITGSTDPETATWVDVSRFAHMADAAQRFLDTVNGN